jgi:hypothetical protein
MTVVDEEEWVKQFTDPVYRRPPALLGSDSGLERAATIEEESGIADQVGSGEVIARSRG